MATPPEKLAQSLEILHGLQNANGAAAIRAKDMTRTHRERLLANGFLQEVIKGWYIPSRPDEVKGESTAWYASFWRFAAVYLEERFGTELVPLAGTVALPPRRETGRCPGSSSCGPQAPTTRSPNFRTERRCWTCGPRCPPADRNEKEGLRLFSLESALIECSPQYFSNHATDARAAMATIRDASGVLAKLLEGGHSTIAGRLAGAFRNSGRDRIADDITKTMSAAGYDVRETDPFTDKPALALPARETSPYVNRIRLLWQKMREPVIGRLPEGAGPAARYRALT